MIKFTAEMPVGTLYGLGLTEANLNRLQFNLEPILFDFGFAGHPNLFGYMFYLPSLPTPESVAENPDLVVERCQAIIDATQNIDFDDLRTFVLPGSIIEKFRSTPFWGYEAFVPITSDADKQLIFSGPDEAAIERYLQGAGLLGSKTKRTYKGFGPS